MQIHGIPHANTDTATHPHTKSSKDSHTDRYTGTRCLPIKLSRPVSAHDLLSVPKLLV